MTLRIMLFSPVSYYRLLLRTKYFPRRRTLDAPFFNVRGQKLSPQKTTDRVRYSD